jgi:hypothetical protein
VRQVDTRERRILATVLVITGEDRRSRSPVRVKDRCRSKAAAHELVHHDRDPELLFEQRAHILDGLASEAELRADAPRKLVPLPGGIRGTRACGRDRHELDPSPQARSLICGSGERGHRPRRAHRTVEHTEIPGFEILVGSLKEEDRRAFYPFHRHDRTLSKLVLVERVEAGDVPKSSEIDVTPLNGGEAFDRGVDPGGAHVDREAQDAS